MFEKWLKEEAKKRNSILVTEECYNDIVACLRTGEFK